MPRQGKLNLVIVLLLLGTGVAFIVIDLFKSSKTFSRSPRLQLQIHRKQKPPELIKPWLDALQEDEACSVRPPPEASLLGLVNLLQEWRQSAKPACRKKEEMFRMIFYLESRYSSLELVGVMKKKMKDWLGGRDDLLALAYNQSLIYIMNQWTYSATIFNSLRAMRPIAKKASSKDSLTDRQYIDKISKEQEENCDFCNYQSNTASDVFGRIYGNYSYTAANVFKLEEWHSLVVFKSHHPTDWNYTEFYDSFLTAKVWFEKVHSVSPHSIYPMIFWDLMGHAGGSQPHPHYHPFVSRDGYYGYFKKWQMVAEEYQAKHDQNYFTHLVQIHFDLGLAVRRGTAVAFSVINPKKDYEFVIIAPDLNKDFVDLLYFIIKAYFEDLEKYCFSAGIVLPPMSTKVAGLPAIARIITRGSVSSVHSDVTSMELFAGSLVEADPYKGIRLLEKSIQNRIFKVS